MRTSTSETVFTTEADFPIYPLEEVFSRTLRATMFRNHATVSVRWRYIAIT